MSAYILLFKLSYLTTLVETGLAGLRQFAPHQLIKVFDPVLLGPLRERTSSQFP